MAKDDNVWVTGNPKKGYAVRTEGADRAASRHDTQGDAIKAGRDLAESRKSELIVQDTHGRIRQKDSFGNDPCPPKDKK
jgi:hypothetical protein